MTGFSLPLQKALVLTQEEALALLEMCAFTLTPEGQVHSSIMARIGELCRGFQGGGTCGESSEWPA